MFTTLIKPEVHQFKAMLYKGLCFVKFDGIERGIRTQTCRELFANYFGSDLKYFSYNCNYGDNPQKTMDFAINIIADFEDRIGLKEEDRIVFQNTSIKYLLKVNVSKWWGTNELRRQLLTALIKSGAVYASTKENGGKDYNFYSIISSSVYFATYPLQKALNRFMDGYQKIKSGHSFGGWVQCFENSDCDSILTN